MMNCSHLKNAKPKMLAKKQKHKKEGNYREIVHLEKIECTSTFEQN